MDNLDLIRDRLETAGEADYILITLSFILCIVASYILMAVYRNKSNSLSSKIQIAPIIPILSMVTFLVILIVKSSLALSLGLVGALSVIRFRTPIKEPEDLAYLFLSIALGIGYGAIQIYATSIIFIIIILILNFFGKRESIGLKNDYNLFLEIKKDKYKKNKNEILKILNENSLEIELIKIESTQEFISVFYRINFKDENRFNDTIELFNNNSDIKFSFYENTLIE